MSAHRITLADDDADALFILNHLVSRMYPHSSVSMFSNASDAFTHILDTGTDLLITNHGMGAMSGTELIKELRKRASRIPIIMMSGDASVREEALTAGANAFIEKSLSTWELEKIVRQLLPD